MGNTCCTGGSCCTWGGTQRAGGVSGGHPQHPPSPPDGPAHLLRGAGLGGGRGAGGWGALGARGGHPGSALGAAAPPRNEEPLRHRPSPIPPHPPPFYSIPFHPSLSQFTPSRPIPTPSQPILPHFCPFWTTLLKRSPRPAHFSPAPVSAQFPPVSRTCCAPGLGPGWGGAGGAGLPSAPSGGRSPSALGTKTAHSGQARCPRPSPAVTGGRVWGEPRGFGGSPATVTTMNCWGGGAGAGGAGGGAPGAEPPGSSAPKGAVPAGGGAEGGGCCCCDVVAVSSVTKEGWVAMATARAVTS